VDVTCHLSYHPVGIPMDGIWMPEGGMARSLSGMRMSALSPSPPGLRRRPRLDCDRTDPRLADGGRQELAAIDVTRLSAMSGHDL
jgi:hypothetical protein